MHRHLLLRNEDHISSDKRRTDASHFRPRSNIFGGLCVRKPKFWVVGAFKQQQQQKSHNQMHFWTSKVCPEYSLRTAAFWRSAKLKFQKRLAVVVSCQACGKENLDFKSYYSGRWQFVQPPAVSWADTVRFGETEQEQSCCPPLCFTWGNLEFFGGEWPERHDVMNPFLTAPFHCALELCSCCLCCEKRVPVYAY